MAGERTVGVVGLGGIGGNLARTLARSGFDVVGFDVRSEAVEGLAGSITPAESAADVSARAELVLVVVFDDDQVRDVLAGERSILAAASPAKVVAILSTVTLDTIRWAYDLGVAHGVAILDCGVTGGKQLSDHGTIVVLAGGDEAVLESVRPIFDTFAEPLLYMGPAGAGIQAKLARNLIHYGTWYAAWEGARLAEACGLDIDKLVEAVRVSDRWTGATMGLLADYEVGPSLVDPGDERKLEMARFLSDVAHKDLRAALELGAERGVTLPGAAVNDELYDAVVGLAEYGREPQWEPAPASSTSG